MDALRSQFLGLTVEAFFTRLHAAVIVIDQEAIVRWVNPAFCALFATTADHVVDTPAAELLTPASRAAFAAALAERKEGERTPYELTGLRSDGTAVEVSALPIRICDDAGRYLGSFAIEIDRSGAELFRDRLSIAERIVENSDIVLYRARLARDFPIEYVSRNVERYGYRHRDFVEGRIRFVDVVLPEDYPRVMAEREQHVARGNQEFSQRYRITTASGQLRWVHDRTTLRKCDGGDAPYLEGILTDVTIQVQAEEERRRTLAQTVRALATTIEKRDAYTAGHQRQVANLSVEIGHRLQLDGDRLEGLYLGALVHDVGKIAIPAELLTKPIALSQAELSIVRSHAVIGRDILEGVTLPWPIASMVGQHHEHLDGSGYPLGLKGDEIIQEARIIAVADMLEAMSEHRPYRRAVKFEAALAELAKRRGSQLDPVVVDACLAIAQEHSNDADQLWPTLERDTDGRRRNCIRGVAWAGTALS